eukprot:2153239-Prorocentrum_lima.AAC.1
MRCSAPAACLQAKCGSGGAAPVVVAMKAAQAMRVPGPAPRPWSMHAQAIHTPPMMMPLDGIA